MYAAHLLYLLPIAGFLAVVSGDSVTNDTVIPKQFIIEVAKDSTIAVLKAEVEALGAVVSKVYDSSVFSGVSVQSLEGNVDSLQTIKAAATVWPSRLVKLGSPTPVKALNSTAQRRRKRDAPVSTAQLLANQAMSPNYSIHSMTGVDKLHAAGIYGKGAQVALIDTGVEYTHPALGGCFGDGCKIAGGYDLVGDGCWPLMGCTKYPDSDPNDLFGVGTALAGVIVGVDEDEGFMGVAPEATIFSYKVFTEEGETDEDTLIEAFLMAYDDGADIISANVVGADGFSDDPLSVVASRMVDEGVVVTVAAGGYGDYGAFHANSGAAGTKVLAVAGVEANTVAESYLEAIFDVDNETSTARIGQLYLYNPMPHTRTGWPIIPLTMSTNVTDDACSPLTGDYPDYSAALALVRLGGCTARVKQQNLIAAGAKNIIFYWDQDSYGSNPYVSRFNSFVLTVPDVAGEAIVEAWQQGGRVTANFSISSDNWVGIPDSAGGWPSSSTSWGPLYDLSIKPDVAAPGGSVFSTYLAPDLWVIQTSNRLASAYVAGVAALYIGQHGGRKTNAQFNATNLVMRILSSGSAVPATVQNSLSAITDFSASVAQVGTGLVNASKVLDYSTQLSLARFALNDTHHFERYHKVDITNNADVDVVYTFAALPAAGYETWNGGFLAAEDLVATNLVPTIHLPSGTFRVSAGSTRTAQINFMYPGSSGNLPIYSGVIQVNSSLGESFSIPYLGLDANLETFFRDKLVPSDYPYIVSGRKSTNFTAGTSWSFNLAVGKQDFPRLHMRTSFGFDEFRWDIFDSSYKEREWIYPPVVGKNHYLGSATYWTYSSSALIYDPADSDYAGNSTAFPILANAGLTSDDSDNLFWWLGPLANGSNIEPGSYVMRVGALIPFGDRGRSDGWVSWVQPFNVV